MDKKKHNFDSIKLVNQNAKENHKKGKNKIIVNRRVQKCLKIKP